jgi:transketolase
MVLDTKIATRQSYGEALAKLGEENKDIVVLDADLSGATKTSIFAKKFPNRFFDMGIAEQDMMGTAVGLSTFGKIPYVSTFAMFAAGRAYDQVRNTIAHTDSNVKICATHAGITVGEDGATHQMLEDIGMMRMVPRMTVISPSDDVQTKWVIEEISKINGPFYIRLSRLSTPVIYDEEFVKINNIKFKIGKGIQIGEGTDGSIIATGVTVAEALKAQAILKQKGINVRVIDLHTIKPIDKELVIKCAKETKKIITIEDHNIVGGLGSAVCETLSDECPTKVIRMGIKDTFGESGKAEELMKYFKIDCDSIVSLF